MPALKYVGKLESILKIGDIIRRQKELIEYANSLHINTEKVRKTNGTLDEDSLTVLIFNVERSRTMFRFRRIGFLLGTFFIFIVLIAAIILYSKF